MKKDKIMAMKAGSQLNIEVYTKVMGKKINTPPNVTVIPSYSKFMESAWLVYENFEEIEVRKYVSAANEFMYECAITIKDVSISHIEKTAPLAICKAALLAVMDS